MEPGRITRLAVVTLETYQQVSVPILDTPIRRATRVLAGAALALMSVIETGAADPRDYRLELVDKSVKAGAGAVIRIRVVNIVTHKSVADADLQVIALDMSPEGMATMSAKAEPVPSSSTEIHAFAADLTMPGRWALSLEARIPGESAPLRDKLLVRAQH